MKITDLTGKKYNRLTVIKRVPRPPNLKDTHSFWLCKCDCGNETIVSSEALTSGNTKSCGCYQKEKIKKICEEYRKTRIAKKNKYIDCGDYIRMTTSNNYDFLIDKEDFNRVYEHCWIYHSRYIVYGTSYNKKRIYVSLHRFILGNIPEGFQVDHINRNPLDNRKANLRIVTPQENQMNRKLDIRNTTGIQNVSRSKTKGKYTSSFKFKHKHYWVGTFDTPEEAYIASVNKRKEIGGLLYEQRNKY